MIRQERVVQTTPGVRTDHLPLSWLSQAVMLTSLAHGVLLVVELEAEVPGERAMKIAGIPQEEPQRSLHGEVGQRLLPRKMMIARGGKAARGAAAKEEVAAVPGTKRRVMRGTATRADPPAVADGKRATQ